jgi:glycine/D-amino acid oxidase-like deaminating enzyme
MTGLATASILAEFFSEVVLLEKDHVLPEQARDAFSRQ